VDALAALATSGQPESALAAQVVRLCAQIRSRDPAVGLDDSTTASSTPGLQPDRRGADRGGRAQLVLATTLYGIWAGISVDVLADVQNDRLLVLYPLLGMAAGLGGSLYATGQWDVSAGQAWAIITGLDYGTYNGLLWSAAISSAPSAKTVFGAALPAGLAGGAVGILVAGYHPNPGGVELVRSGGLYGTAAALMSALAFAPDNVSSQVIFTTLALGMDVGLATGAGLSSRLGVSRNRMLLVDAGTIAGLGFGLGGTWLVTGSQGSSRRALGAGGLLGLAAGMTAAILLTRGMDGDRVAESSGPGPVPALVQRRSTGQWGLGTLALTPVCNTPGGRQAFVGASVPLVGGLW
jgi:hypothetical protein